MEIIQREPQEAEDQNEDKPFAKHAKLLKIIFKILPTILIILFVMVIFLLSGRIKSKAAVIKAQKLAEVKKEDPAINVVVQKIVSAPIKDRINLPGTVEPWDTLRLISEVNGKVVDVKVKEGDHVNKGDLLVQIDPRDYQNSIESVSASYDLAVSTQERVQKLYDMELTPKAELDRVNAQLKNAKSQLEAIVLQLKKCEIRSPISGIVNSLPAKVGLYLNAFMPVPVIEILNIDKVKIVVGIPESDIDAVRGVEYFDVVIDALSGKKIRAKRHFISNSQDTMARLYKLELVVDNAGHQILPGMFVRVDVVMHNVSNAVSIPLYAVIAKDKQKYVYIEKDGKAYLTDVETGILEGWRIQITKGLKPNDKVIVVGQRSIGDGQTVKIVKEVENAAELIK